MDIKIDWEAVQKAARVNTVAMVDGERRTYYLLPMSRELDMLVVVRHDLVLEGLVGSVVDVRVGWDVIHPGYGDDNHIGKKRSKVTIYKKVNRTTYEKTLSQIAQYEEAVE